MYHTLIELERIHKCPMIVRDAFNHSWHLVLRADPISSNVYEAKGLAPNQHSATPGTPTTILYGGYARFVFIGKPEENGISPEDQKRIKAAERKLSNDKIIRGLKHDQKKKALTAQDKRMQRLKRKPDDADKVISINRPKKDK